MNATEALHALIAADPRRSYCVEQESWAHINAVQGFPHVHASSFRIGIVPGIDGEKGRCSYFSATTIEEVTEQALAALGQPSAAQEATEVAMTEPASTWEPDAKAKGYNTQDLTNAEVGRDFRLLNHDEAQFSNDEYASVEEDPRRVQWYSNPSTDDGKRADSGNLPIRRRIVPLPSTGSTESADILF